MNKTYESHLMENEVVLWEDRPVPFKLLDSVYKNSLLTSWIICGLVVIAYLALYIPYSIANELMGSNVIVISIVIGACVTCAMARPIIDKNNLEKKTTFVLTNHRALVINGTNLKAMFINSDTPCKIVKMDNGASIILMGSAVNTSLKKSRSNSLMGVLDENNKSKLSGMVFYSVNNAEKVCDCYAPFKVN